MSERHTGRCACGAVRYTVTGPLRSVIGCHCESCRRQTGNYMTASAAALADIVIEGEENLAKWRATDQAVRRFCRICGSHLFWQRNGAPMVSIMAGSLDAPTGLVVSHHIYAAEKGDYYEIVDGLPVFPARKDG